MSDETSDQRTIFARIIDREIPAEIVHETERALAFRDINGQAPTHVLVIPKKPIPTVNDIREEDGELIGHLFTVAGEVAVKEGIADDGYRLVVNCNAHGGQTVYHLHMHLIGGKHLGWPPFPG